MNHLVGIINMRVYSGVWGHDVHGQTVRPFLPYKMRRTVVNVSALTLCVSGRLGKCFASECPNKSSVMTTSPLRAAVCSTPYAAVLRYAVRCYPCTRRGVAEMGRNHRRPNEHKSRGKTTQTHQGASLLFSSVRLPVSHLAERDPLPMPSRAGRLCLSRTSTDSRMSARERDALFGASSLWRNCPAAMAGAAKVYTSSARKGGWLLWSESTLVTVARDAGRWSIRTGRPVHYHHGPWRKQT